MPFPPSAAGRFFDLPPVNLQNLPLHLTKNSFASAPTHLCGIALSHSAWRNLWRLRRPFAPTYKLVLYQPLTGRGGSVSRRDHNQATGNRAQLAWAHKFVGTHKPIPIHSSGEGVWGRGASLREAASPTESLQHDLFGRGPGGGASL